MGLRSSWRLRLRRPCYSRLATIRSNSDNESSGKATANRTYYALECLRQHIHLTGEHEKHLVLLPHLRRFLEIRSIVRLVPLVVSLVEVQLGNLERIASNILPILIDLGVVDDVERLSRKLTHEINDMILVGMRLRIH